MRKRPMLELPLHVRRVVAKGREYSSSAAVARSWKGRVPPPPRSAQHRILASLPHGARAIRQPAGRTFNDLTSAYRISPEFRAEAAITQRNYERYLKLIAEA